jgi:transposase
MKQEYCVPSEWIVDTNMKQLTQNVVMVRQGKRGPYRQWPEAQKRLIVAETYDPGMSVSIVARRHDVNANQVFRWRQLYGRDSRSKKAVADFIRLGVIEPAPVEAEQKAGIITIDLGNTICVRVDRDVDEGALSRVLTVVRGLS